MTVIANEALPAKLIEFMFSVGGASPPVVTSTLLESMAIPWAEADSARALRYVIEQTPFVMHLDDGKGGGHWVAVCSKGSGGTRRLWYADPLGAELLQGYPSEVLSHGHTVIVNLKAFQNVKSNHCGYIAMMVCARMTGRLPNSSERFTNVIATLLGVPRPYKAKGAVSLGGSGRCVHVDADSAVAAAAASASTPPEPKIVYRDVFKVPEGMRLKRVGVDPAASEAFWKTMRAAADLGSSGAPGATRSGDE